jgi:hypothetical protein
MKTLTVDRPFLDDEGVTRLRGDKITVSDARAKDLVTLKVVGGHHRRQVRDRQNLGEDARIRRRIEGALRVLQSYGLAPAELTYDKLVQAAEESGDDRRRRTPEPRRTQDKPEPTRHDAPPRETKAEDEDEEDDQDDDEIEGTISEDGLTFTAADGETRETTAEEREAFANRPPAETQPPPPPEPPPTGRRQRGNRGQG